MPWNKVVLQTNLRDRIREAECRGHRSVSTGSEKHREAESELSLELCSKVYLSWSVSDAGLGGHSCVQQSW